MKNLKTINDELNNDNVTLEELHRITCELNQNIINIGENILPKLNNRIYGECIQYLDDMSCRFHLFRKTLLSCEVKNDNN